MSKKTFFSLILIAYLTSSLMRSGHLNLLFGFNLNTNRTQDRLLVWKTSLSHHPWSASRKLSEKRHFENPYSHTRLAYRETHSIGIMSHS